MGGVFTYTNGTDIENGLPDRRLDGVKSRKPNGVQLLPNGVPNGTMRNGTPDWSHPTTGSVHSAATTSAPDREQELRAAEPSEVPATPAILENADHQRLGGLPQMSATAAPNPHRLDMSSPSPRLQANAPRLATETTDAAVSPRSAESAISPLTVPSSLLHRFSSPPGMSPGASIQDRRADALPDRPHIIHRHTLQIPKSPLKGSRDFSFSGAPSEEAVFATGRFSPTHTDQVRPRRPSLGLGRRQTRSVHSDVHLDEVMPDEDALRWTEAIRQKRASRRKRKEEEDDDRVVVGKKVEEGHVNWVTAYNMLTGIRFVVSRTNAKIDRVLNEADFTSKHKYSFDVTGSELTPSAKYDFKFKDYAPWVFRHLRAIFGLDPADYLVSLTSKYILSELGSPGKSGSFFYFSRDYKYIIKTIHHAEHKLLRKILRDYYNHIIQNPNTLISQFYGLHRVKIPYGRKIHFVVMNNLFPPHRDVHQMFDLKGSTVGRDFREEDLATNPRATLKDLNWLRRDMHLGFDARIKRLFVEQLQRDVALLQRLHIMDYSLLVGIHDLERGNEENLRETTLRVFQPGGERDEGDVRTSMLMRTPSRLENQRKARELRLTLKKEKPVPMGQVSAKMPDVMLHDDQRRGRLFYGDDGGIRATHEDGRGGEEIYYMGIIDCLTHVSLGPQFPSVHVRANRAATSTASSNGSSISGKDSRTTAHRSHRYRRTNTATGS